MNFRLVPNSLEAIIGKTRIDELDTMPLVEIDYNIQKPVNRFIKRMFDCVAGSLLLVTLYPTVRWRGSESRPGSLRAALLLIPGVFRGQLSLVGRPLTESDIHAREGSPGFERGVLGPRGLTGLVQINERDDLTEEERDRYKLYYAKNQSLILDIEIILKALLSRKK